MVLALLLALLLAALLAALMRKLRRYTCTRLPCVFLFSYTGTPLLTPAGRSGETKACGGGD